MTAFALKKKLRKPTGGMFLYFHPGVKDFQSLIDMLKIIQEVSIIKKSWCINRTLYHVFDGYCKFDLT